LRDHVLIFPIRTQKVPIIPILLALIGTFPKSASRIKHRFLFRRFRGDEFLEARIVPERIEHWIEPEERGSERHAFSQCP
jgi:hypothetical protein